LFYRYKEVRMPNLRLADSEVFALLAFLDKHATVNSSEMTVKAK
jgi:hypothetical protein